MNPDRSFSHKFNKLHKRALRIAYDDYCSSFEEPLDKDESLTIHQHNLRALAIVGIAFKRCRQAFGPNG